MRSERTPDYSRYARDPIGFARDVLKVELTPDQKRIALACLEPPYRVMVKSGHNVGKSLLVAVLVLWWYFTRPTSTVLTTSGGNINSVKDIVWTEVRLLVARAGLPDHFIGPAAPEMRTDPDHWAKGMTAATGEGFQGRHRAHAMFAFDEAEDVDRVYWDTTGTMFQPDGTNLLIAILNPTTTTSHSYREERATDLDGNPKWKVFSLSSLDHPNIAAGLRGEAIPVPQAVSLGQVEQWLGDWFEPIDAAEFDPDLDVEFPPQSGRFWRPDPEGESRVLGRRPSAGTFGVWSERLWKRVCNNILQPEWGGVPQIGCDVARFGDDRTEIHVRCGSCSLSHEDHGGWDTTRTADRLIELTALYAEWANKNRDQYAVKVEAKQIPVKVDDTGVGGGVTDLLVAGGYSVVPVNAGEAAKHRPDKYPRVRDELWFMVKERAREGRLDLSRLGLKRLARLELQALAPTWKPTADRRRQVETKEETKKRLKRSPDGLDALNLSYYEVATGDVAKWVGGPGGRENWRDRAGRRR